VKRQAAVFVTVPADALVGEFRQRHQPRAVARLLPPHVTIVPPFALDTAEDDAVAVELAAHFATLLPFEAELAGVGSFERHVWLAPEPGKAFVSLITSTRSCFPELDRDGERQPVPHLTIAEVDRGESASRVARLAEEVLGPHLPFRFDVREVALWVVGPQGWHELRRFGLG
jgi:2'-5' RNA ligase